VEGLDFSTSMLEVARERMLKAGVSISFHCLDIRALHLPSAFDFVFLPTGTFMHLLNQADVASFLAGARRTLKPSGVLAVDVHNPTAFWRRAVEASSSAMESTFQHPRTGELISVRSTTKCFPDRQVVTVHHRYAFATGAMREGTIVLKCYGRVELQSLLEANGYHVEHTYGGYGREPFESESPRQIIVARPTGGSAVGSQEPAGGLLQEASALPKS
jgi:ubiquinone/menaquinone biosynthesis C-methylase UbiE